MAIKVTLPSGIEITGDNREDLREIFAFVESKESPAAECKKVLLTEYQYQIYCVIADFPGSHSGQIGKALKKEGSQIATVLSTLRNLGVVERRTDGHYGWNVVPGVEGVLK